MNFEKFITKLEADIAEIMLNHRKNSEISLQQSIKKFDEPLRNLKKICDEIKAKKKNPALSKRE